MPDTSDKKEQREPRAQQESAAEKQTLLEKHFEDGAQDIVQEALWSECSLLYLCRKTCWASHTC